MNLNNQALKVIDQARQEAIQLNHSYIGTEHILLALLADDSLISIETRQAIKLEPEQVRREIAKLVYPGAEPSGAKDLPLTPRSTKVLEYATAEARLMQEKQIGPEHLLLGVLREPDGVAGRVLRNLGIKLEPLCEQVFKFRLLQMKIVERTVRPVRASPARKRKMREELLAHLEGIYAEERARLSDPMAAITEASRRFGDPGELTREFERALPWTERFGYHLERISGWRPPETATRWMLRLAVQMVIITGLTFATAFVVAWAHFRNVDAAFAGTAPIAAMFIFMPLVQFALGVLYFKARDALFGVFGAPKSLVRAALLSAMTIPLGAASGFGFVVLASGDVSRAIAALYPGSLVGAAMAAFLLAVARTSGPSEIRDTIWACLKLSD